MGTPSTISYNGVDYQTTVDGKDLGVIFNYTMAASVPAAGTDKFAANVAAYHTNDAFRKFVDEQYETSGQMAAGLLMVVFGGPGAIESIVKAAKSSGLVKTVPGVKRVTHWSKSLLKALTSCGVAAMNTFLDESRDELKKTCGIPDDVDFSGDLVAVLQQTGKQSVGSKIGENSGIGAGGGEGPHAIRMKFEIDINNPARSKAKEDSDESSDSDDDDSEDTAQPSAK